MPLAPLPGVTRWLGAIALVCSAAISLPWAEELGTPSRLRARDAHGHLFDIADFDGQVVVLTVASRKTAHEARTISSRLSSVVSPGRVAVVALVNLESVPWFAIRYAKRRVAEEAAHSRFIVLPDEGGRLCRRLAVRGAEILLFDRRGQLRYRFRGTTELEQALQTVEELQQESLPVPR